MRPSQLSVNKTFLKWQRSEEQGEVPDVAEEETAVGAVEVAEEEGKEPKLSPSLGDQDTALTPQRVAATAITVMVRLPGSAWPQLPAHGQQRLLQSQHEGPTSLTRKKEI